MSPHDPTPARLLTVCQAAELLNTSTKTIRRRIREGALPVVRDGRLIRIRPEDLRVYIVSRLTT